MWYLKYLPIQHDYRKYNCFTLVSEIYKNELGICLPTATRLGYKEDFSIPNRFALRKLNTQLIDFESQFWKKIDLTALKEYDILVFNTRIIHFGVYINNNLILHLPEESKVLVDELNDYHRSTLYGCYRYCG